MKTHTRTHAITRTATLGLAACAALALAACGNVGVGGPHTLSGTVHGGNSPVTGSTVSLYAAGVGQAQSLIGNYVTDGNGNWTLTFTCPAGDPPMYVIAHNGNPGLSVPTANNHAIHLLAALGPCSSIPAHININEITTVAAAYALKGFFNPSNTNFILSSATNATGLANAMATAAGLADVTTGKDGPIFVGAANAAPEDKLNSLANSLAACVNTSGKTSSQCAELFACALPGASYSGNTCTGGSGTPAANTLKAILDIAENPGLVSMAGVYNAATRNAVFSPALSAAPTDETLALNFTGGGLNSPQGIAIDAAGNVWTVSKGNNSVDEFSPTGAAISPFAGYPGGGLNDPLGIAIDANGNVWTPSYGNGTVNEFVGGSTPPATCPTTLGSTDTGCPLSGSGYTGGGYTGSYGIAIDASGNVWTASANNTINEFNSSGIAISLPTGDTGGGLSAARDIAIDPAGNVWTSSSGNSTVNEFNASGTAISPSTISLSTGYTGGGLNDPQGIAIDASGNIWTTSLGNSTLNKFVGGSTPTTHCPALPVSGDTGCPLSGGYTGGGLVGSSRGIAIDASGNVWTASANNSVNEFSSSGTALSPSTGYTGGRLDDSLGIAIDASGNVWVANAASNSLTELIGTATPTRTPLVATLTQGFAP